MFDKSNHIFPSNGDFGQSLNQGHEGSSSDFRFSSRPSTAGQLPSLSDPSPAQRPATAGARPFSANPSAGLGAYHLGSRTLETKRPQTAAVIVPRFVTTDKQICRFHAYIETERFWNQAGPLGPSQIEPSIVRHMTILYYIYDDTIEISEARETNSGMWQGVFLPEIQPGRSSRFLGQTFHITDADQFTRDYFERELQITLPGPTRPQTASQRSLSRSFVPGHDQGHKTHMLGAQFATGLGATEATTVHDKAFNTRSTDYLVTKEGLDKTYRFLKYEGRKLRFLCIEVRNRHPPYSTRFTSSERRQEKYATLTASGTNNTASSARTM